MLLLLLLLQQIEGRGKAQSTSSGHVCCRFSLLTYSNGKKFLATLKIDLILIIFIFLCVLKGLYILRMYDEDAPYIFIIHEVSKNVQNSTIAFTHNVYLANRRSPLNERVAGGESHYTLLSV